MSSELNQNHPAPSDGFPFFGQEAHLQGIRSWGIMRLRGQWGESELEIDAPGHLEPADLEPVDLEPADLENQVKSREEALEEMASEVASCQLCSLCETRNRTAFGVGDPHAELMLVGEAPGHEEDRRGEPFVGRAGQLLNRIIGALGLERDQVYIANVLKCRPPQNRDPQPQETAACRKYLERQIELIQPKVLVALGRPAACWLTGQETSLGRLRGRFHDWRGIPVMATYHPAFLLRQEQFKAACWQDFQQVIERLHLTPVQKRT